MYLIIAVEALPWDWSFFLSYFNQYLSHYVNTKQSSQHRGGAASCATADESLEIYMGMKYDFATLANAVLFHLCIIIQIQMS